ncbi:hypothetical protein Pcinc_028224 [Petrolisthes cinctipes]|uniref:Uncharacterized protein n=1 Tax=Petrolisthes cinctipes TaxID=88211 RepID=A0AAE1K7K4_PETCI|nr:hypothetical protein Pcinc_028224 [Petrolisthes cinctipes]
MFFSLILHPHFPTSIPCSSPLFSSPFITRFLNLFFTHTSPFTPYLTVHPTHCNLHHPILHSSSNPSPVTPSLNLHPPHPSPLTPTPSFNLHPPHPSPLTPTPSLTSHPNPIPIPHLSPPLLTFTPLLSITTFH